MRAIAIVLIAGVFLCGCSAEAPPRRKLEELRGDVDTTLPPAQQEKQKVIKRIFDELQSRTHYTALKQYHADVRMIEPLESYMEGTLGMSRWNFNGKPEKDDVPVVLFMLEDKPDNPERRVERVYTVTGSPGNYTISRKR
jgi:hypothetical protein